MADILSRHLDKVARLVVDGLKKAAEKKKKLPTIKRQGASGKFVSTKHAIPGKKALRTLRQALNADVPEDKNGSFMQNLQEDINQVVRLL